MFEGVLYVYLIGWKFKCVEDVFELKDIFDFVVVVLLMRDLDLMIFD